MLLLLQIAIIVGFSRVVTWLFRPLREPAVVAEMAAGLMLGPSGFGWMAPSWSQALFPESSLDAINSLSQIGLVLFMWLVGLRVRLHAATASPSAAAVTSAISIVVPFALGAVLAVHFHDRLAPPSVGVLPFALFVGAAMSITAFPVLARILSEHDLVGTELGTLAIACAAFDDVTGWMILAGILSFVRRSQSEALLMRAGLFTVYLIVMLTVVRPLMERWYRKRESSRDALAVVLLVALLSAVATDALGVHALFGAFFAGLMMPRSRELEATLADRIEPLTTTLLLPLFFAFSGLRTRVGLIDSAALWQDTALVLTVAIVAKGGASSLAARAAGVGWRNACALGVLVNTRGLIELVILNIGLETGILSPLAFSIFVLMALVTTFMTSPLLHVLGLQPRRVGASV